ncbi:MAG TPA: phytoene desaturase family protein, partial [Paludibacter sp.]|nr:phytoene desaturase family protein [Paludibacter sp.]
MVEQKKAIIIGSGIGGLATSVFLARKGFKVSVYEKNATPGGRCGQINQDGYRFDLGATILLMPSIYREVFSALGMDLDSELETTSLEPVYKLFFSDGTDFVFTRQPEKMKLQLESMEAGSSAHYDKYIGEGYSFFRLAMNGLLNRNFTRFFSFINFRNAWMMVRFKTWIKHTSYIKRFFKDLRLQRAFTFQNIYVGQNPYSQPAFFSMLPGAEIAEGALFPQGGMYRIVERLMDTATGLGVRFEFKKPVGRIVVEGCKAKGIELENGKTIEADMVIANADLPYVYDQLLPDKKISNQLKKKEYSCSAIVFHWGLDKTYPQLDHHS